MREVASKAGVSIATVSRALNDVDVKMSPETRMRVQRIAMEVGYQPNRAAQMLVTGRANCVALCVPNISTHTARVISAASEELVHHGYDLIVSEVRVDRDGLIGTTKLLPLPVDGIIFCDLPHGVMIGLDHGLLWGKPYVSLGVYVTPNSDFVKVDLQSATSDAIRHFHANGCRRIAYLVPGWMEWFRAKSDERLVGYDRAIAEIGLKPRYILTPNAARNNVAEALSADIAKNGFPDAIFCFNDEMGVAAMRTLKNLGRRIPDEVAIAGCDGIEEGLYHDPPLTTITMPIREMFATAWSFLSRRIARPEVELQQLTVRPALDIRGSSVR